MPHQEILCPDSISTRKMPVNFNQTDASLFEHEIKKTIPATYLQCLEEVAVSPEGILFRGSNILPQSFPSPDFVNTWAGKKTRFKLFVKYYLSAFRKRIEQEGFWFTDTWSHEYFHWMTDALPRLLSIREKIKEGVVLLPGTYVDREYVVSSLKPFAIQNIMFVHETLHCKNLKIPTHTAPTGNYNESLIRDLRKLFTDFGQPVHGAPTGNKIYVSRGKAQRRRIANEEECVAILSEYGFQIIHFEDYLYEQQVEIAKNAQYVISNHGAGLTNMLFMKSGSSILELRRIGDCHNNCFFSLASALRLKYYYQNCESEHPDEDTYAANLIVDCRLLRETIEHMLAE